MRVILFKDLHPVKGIQYGMNQLDRLMAAGKFPKSFFLSERKQAWDEAEIDAWLKERKAARVRETENA
jgi:predicted DNA-binding transcriptional regulator AlpA